MAQIKQYLNDGANWQAQAVLAYLRSQCTEIEHRWYNEKIGRYMPELTVGRYENGREQGYVFSVHCSFEQRNYAVYEHRNSDKLIVLIFDKLTLNTPCGEEVWGNMKNEYDYTNDFEFGKIVECGDYIIEDAKAFIDKVKANLEENHPSNN